MNPWNSCFESCKVLFYKEYVLWRNFKLLSNFSSSKSFSPENLVLGKISNLSIALTSTIFMVQICLRTDIIFNYYTCFSSLHFFMVFIRLVCSSSLFSIMIFICFIPIKAFFTSSSTSISPVLEKPKRYVQLFSLKSDKITMYLCPYLHQKILSSPVFHVF